MVEWLKKEFDLIVAKLDAEAKSAYALIISFFKEVITEEEAALFPAFKAQVIQLFNDEAKMTGLDVQSRVALAVAEGTADLAQNVVIAKNALFNSWAWAIAHKTGQINGNQGNFANGVDAGSADSTSSSSAA